MNKRDQVSSKEAPVKVDEYELKSSNEQVVSKRHKNEQIVQTIAIELEEKWNKEMCRKMRDQQEDSGSDSEPQRCLLKEIEVEEFIHLADTGELCNRVV